MRRGRLALLIVLLAAVLAAAGVRLFCWDRFVGLATRARMAIAPTAQEREQDRARRALAALDAHDPAALERVVKEAGTADLHAAGGETPLLHAIRAGEGAAVRWLVTQGARVTEVPGKPLLRSLPPPPTDELRALLAAGADPYAKDEHGYSYFSAVVSEPTTERLQVVLASRPPPDRSELQNDLAYCAGSGRIEQVKLLLAAGADPRVGGGVVLSGAASTADAPLVKLLLDAGADPDAHSGNAEAPIVVASRRGAVDVVKELLSRPGKRAGLEEALARAVENQYADVAVALHAAGAPLPEDTASRVQLDHLLARAAGGDAAAFAERHEPVAAAWDGPLLVGNLLLERCQAASPGDGEHDAPARWTDVDLPVSSLGRAEGDDVLALLADGRHAPAKLGKLSCSRGECGDSWYTFELAGMPSGQVLAVAPPGFVAGGAKVYALKEKRVSCAAARPAPPNARMKPTCTRWSGDGTVAVDLLVYDDPVDEIGMGYFPATAFARFAGSETLRAWTKLGDGSQGDVFTPALAIEQPRAPARVLFRRPGGLGDTVLRVGRAAPDRGLELGRAFAAGGQPCD